MKAIEILKHLQLFCGVELHNDCYEAVEELETLQQELKQGQENYDKLWDMYSELTRENRVIQEYINETKDCGSCKLQRAIKIYDERKNK